jgi:hypothetical protein
MLTNHMTRFPAIITLFFGALSCSIICGTACEFVKVGQCAGPGGLFGPCDDHIFNRCLGILECTETKIGNICTPPAAVADDFDVAECAAWRGTMACSEALDSCFLACDGPDDCEGGTVCDEFFGQCLYPHDGVQPQPPAGEMFGPCTIGGGCNDGTECVERALGGFKGTICLPTCDVCASAEVIEESQTIGITAPACIPDDLCAIHCGSQDDCTGNSMCMDGLCLRLD